jgi:hypothetical protein
MQDAEAIKDWEEHLRQVKNFIIQENLLTIFCGDEELFTNIDPYFLQSPNLKAVIHLY